LIKVYNKYSVINYHNGGGYLPIYQLPSRLPEHHLLDKYAYEVNSKCLFMKFIDQAVIGHE